MQLVYLGVPVRLPLTAAAQHLPQHLQVAQDAIGCSACSCKVRLAPLEGGNGALALTLMLGSPWLMDAGLPGMCLQVAERVNALARGKPNNHIGIEAGAVITDSGQLRCGNSCGLPVA